MRDLPLLLARTMGGRLLAVGVCNYNVEFLRVELLALNFTREEVGLATGVSNVDGFVGSDTTLHGDVLMVLSSH